MTIQEGLLIALVSAGIVWVFHGVWLLKDWHLAHFVTDLDDEVRKRILTCTTLQVGFPLALLASLGIRLSMQDTSDISKSLVLSTMGYLIIDIIVSICIGIALLCVIATSLCLLLILSLFIEDAYNAGKLQSLFLKFTLFAVSLMCVSLLFS